ncbi:hypothetical protein FJZ33_12505 [Candidatus Poribacteria bacterium]|nr:hypothetical protein [Candidatus Poribacteria bacterium]
MKELQPSESDWKALYHAALEFKKIECWKWMLDSDIFGVQNPANGEIGYCCVMGYLGEHFALAIYLGSEGLEAYLKVQRNEINTGNIEALMIQKCLMVSFEDREILYDEDRDIIKKLDLKFRGRKQWPLFRNYQPGYYPWFVNKAEAQYLTLTLEQVIEIALCFKENPNLLDPPKKDHYLVRTPEKSENGGLQWKDKWFKPISPEESKSIAPPINEIRLQKIKKAVKRKSGIWQADFFLSPTPVREFDERPYYPYAALFVDGNSGLILHVNMLKPEEYMTGFPNDFMAIMEKSGIKPSEVHVRKKEALNLLKTISERLDIQLKLVKRLEAMEYLQSSMFQFFR